MSFLWNLYNKQRIEEMNQAIATGCGNYDLVCGSCAGIPGAWSIGDCGTDKEWFITNLPPIGANPPPAYRGWYRIDDVRLVFTQQVFSGVIVGKGIPKADPPAPLYDSPYAPWTWFNPVAWPEPIPAVDLPPTAPENIPIQRPAPNMPKAPIPYREIPDIPVTELPGRQVGYYPPLPEPERPAPVTNPGTVIPGLPIHVRRPPGPRTKERKTRITNPWGEGVIRTVADALSEAGDWVDAAWDAIPWHIRRKLLRRGEYRNFSAKVNDVYRHWESIDVGKFLENVIKMELGDRIAAMNSRQREALYNAVYEKYGERAAYNLQRAFRNMDRVIGTQT